MKTKEITGFLSLVGGLKNREYEEQVNNWLEKNKNIRILFAPKVNFSDNRVTAIIFYEEKEDVLPDPSTIGS
jgi:hypothetical protein